MKLKNYLVFAILLSIKSLFGQKTTADLIVLNAKIYTADAKFSIAEAMAITDGKIIAVGKTAKIKKKYTAKNTYDAAGKTIIPGMIDAHAHFFGYGEGLQYVDLVGTKSWEEVLERLKTFMAKRPEIAAENKWLLGRGWDQNDWAKKEFPTKSELDILYPNTPVMLTRVDGHAAVVNQKALDLAGIAEKRPMEGGEMITDEKGKLTGVFIDNASDLIAAVLPKNNAETIKKALFDAQKNCFAVGLTTVTDCGLNADMIPHIERLHTEGGLKMRLNVMYTDDYENYKYAFKRGIIQTDRLVVRSFKLYADGALGSRGACLLHPYADRKNYYGFLLKDTSYYAAVARKLHENGFQMCTHAIGDSANRAILKIYANVLKGKNDLRWRIEHAQVMNENDFGYFGRYNIVPSVQPTHATSDMYWAGQRLGAERERTAYAWKTLLQQNNWIPLGTDFPVENINPILTFYAAVVRKDAVGFPEKGYQMHDALTREETLRGMTIWAAKAHFEEKVKGSIEAGKFADFVVLNQDIMTVAPDKILKTEVLKTFLAGEEVFSK